MATATPMKDAMVGLNADLAATYGVQLNIRVGLSTGEVVAASGSTFDRDFLISDAVTTAARIQQTVAPGTVVVGEGTFRLIRDAIAYRELPPMDVEGKTAPLIGREQEIRVCHRAPAVARALLTRRIWSFVSVFR